jgi:hypothetical protein
MTLPHGCPRLSALADMDRFASLEGRLVGDEGVVGIQSVLGSSEGLVRPRAQDAGPAWRMDTAHYLAVQAQSSVAPLVVRYL